MPRTIAYLLLLAAAAAHAQSPNPPRADLILIHGTVLTVDAHDSIAQAIAIRSGRILAVGSDQQILSLSGPDTTVIDLHGRTATPGLIDTHSHYGEAGSEDLYNLSLQNATSVAEIVHLVQQRVATAKPGEWILGRGWDEGKFAEHRYILASDLDKVSPNNPVWLVNTTGHYGVVNSYALRLAHIDADTKNPPAGTIDRDPSGQITGVMKEAANQQFFQLVPKPSLDQIKNGILAEIEKLHSEGLTSVKDTGSEPIWNAYNSLHSEGKLTERVCMLWRAGDTLQTAKDALAKMQQASPIPHASTDDRLILCGAKIFMDGSAVARTAWSYKPWVKNMTELDTGNTGYPSVDPDVYRQQVHLFHDAGVSIGTHAIGDRAIDWVVDTYAEVLKEKPAHNTRDTIIHAYLPTPHAIDTMALLEKQYGSGYPEVQPTFMWWLGKSIPPSLGPERLAHTMPLKTYLDHGIHWGAGSDYGVVPFAPRYGLWASVERESITGEHPFGTAESVDIHVALRSYTAWAAPLLFLEDQIGTIEPGKRADIAIWDRDPYTIPSQDLKNLKCELTIFDGAIVYKADTTPITMQQPHR
jgi:predicted amidohydrolase YtcJ